MQVGAHIGGLACDARDVAATAVTAATRRPPGVVGEQGARIGQIGGATRARARVIDAALALFADHGVNGTSLQMIADHLGVSKASVYYQFHSKDDIVLAVIRPVFADLDQLATAIEAEEKAAR